MQTEENTSKGVSQVEGFLMKAKVALALAIIKTKPPGMSGAQYAEALACKLKSKDERWKEKAQGLQQEVLKLRQELLVAGFMSDKKSNIQTADSERMDCSGDLFDAGGGEPEPTWDSETPELLQMNPQPSTAAPPPPVPSPHSSSRGNAMFTHMQFFQSLCFLRHVDGRSRCEEALKFGLDRDEPLLVESLCQLLGSIVAACKNPPKVGPPNLVLEACHVVSRVMEVFVSQKRPSAEFKDRVAVLLKELTGMLLHGKQPITEEKKQVKYLMALGSNILSKSILIRHILSEISTLTDQLWQSTQNQDVSVLQTFPLDEYENSCYLFSVLEELLQNSSPGWLVEDGPEVKGFLSCVENVMFPISDAFPLFSMRMWKIGGLLTSTASRDAQSSNSAAHCP